MTIHASTAGPTSDTEGLRALALDLRWSWNHAADRLWSELEPDLWSRTHNPWVVVQSVSAARVAQVFDRPDLRELFERLQRVAAETAATKRWFQHAHPTGLARVAYFSMEFMLSEALPIYAGGLGNVAGDQLKAASDLGVPVLGVGLLYSQGYFRQVIDRDGAQQALLPYNDPGQLPVTPVRGLGGEWLRIDIPLPGRRLSLRAWQVKVGRLVLYLLDSNDLINDPADRGITSELYGGGSELRLKQELVLGIGGWRLLEQLSLTPEVCHLNEGHAAFAVLERARGFMEETRQPFDVAMTSTRVGNVFTTHTAVPAGFDRFAPDLIEQYLGGFAGAELGISVRELLALGRRDAGDAAESFNMAYLAMRGSGMINGVSRLHGEVSRGIFLPLYPRWPASDVPVGHITNGVHTPSWDSAAADAMWTHACGKERWHVDPDALSERMRDVPDDALWDSRSAARAALVDYVRERLTGQLVASGTRPEQAERVRGLFSPHALTLGFARRFATYKRPNLLLSDPERFVRLLTNAAKPVQIILAGKAHPADFAGQALVREWVNFVRRDDVRAHAVFLADYDMSLTEQLVGGVDVWINTPERPWEACGTSGMKVLVNGGLNLSELDGWWAEAYTPQVGWALGDGRDHGGAPEWDAIEAAQLYELLESSVIPEFYDRDAQGIPARWVARIRESMASLTPRFSANRAVRDYTERCYLPAAAAYRRRAAERAALGVDIERWRRSLLSGWSTLRFGQVSVETQADQHHFRVEVQFGAVDRQAVQVEIFAEARGADPAVREIMRHDRSGAAAGDGYVATVSASRPVSEYTARIVPAHADAAVPLEAALILWQR